MLWHQANAFRYIDRSETRLIISSPGMLFGSSVGGSESRAAYQCPYWKCARLAFCLDASVAGAREHSSGALEGFVVFCAHIRWRHSVMVTPDPPQAAIMNLVSSSSTESQGMSATSSESNRKPLFDVAIAFNLPMPWLAATVSHPLIACITQIWGMTLVRLDCCRDINTNTFIHWGFHHYFSWGTTLLVVVTE